MVGPGSAGHQLLHNTAVETRVGADNKTRRLPFSWRCIARGIVQNCRMPLKLLTILDCVRPVLFQNDSKECPISFGGSAFLVRFQDQRTFVVTAWHVLRESEFKPHQFSIQCRPDVNAFLRLGAHYRIQGSDTFDTDQYDIVAWDVAPVSDAVYGHYKPYSVWPMEGNTIFTPAADYLYRGYPQQLRIPEYATQSYDQGAISGSAKYIGRTELECIRSLELNALGPIHDLDGVSGSPVFQVTKDVDTYSVPSFAGMIIRGSAQSRVALFVESRRIVDMLQGIVAGNTIPFGT
jgi:hypothetical protein